MKSFEMGSPVALAVCALLVFPCGGCSLDWSLPGSGQGGAGGALVTTTITLDCLTSETCECPSGATCSIQCTGAGCHVVCHDGASCEISCVGSDCLVTCGAGATCTTSCLGTCTMNCDATAECSCEPSTSCN